MLGAFGRKRALGGEGLLISPGKLSSLGVFLLQRELLRGEHVIPL